jgi:hypothetical protein
MLSEVKLSLKILKTMVDPSQVCYPANFFMTGRSVIFKRFRPKVINNFVDPS